MVPSEGLSVQRFAGKWSRGLRKLSHPFILVCLYMCLKEQSLDTTQHGRRDGCFAFSSLFCVSTGYFFPFSFYSVLSDRWLSTHPAMIPAFPGICGLT